MERKEKVRFRCYSPSNKVELVKDETWALFSWLEVNQVGSKACAFTGKFRRQGFRWEWETRWPGLTGAEGSKCLGFNLGIFICETSVCILRSHNFVYPRLALTSVWNQRWLTTSVLPHFTSPVLGFTGCYHIQSSEASSNCWISLSDLLIFKITSMQANPSLVLNLGLLPRPLYQLVALLTSFCLSSDFTLAEISS